MKTITIVYDDFHEYENDMDLIKKGHLLIEAEEILRRLYKYEDQETISIQEVRSLLSGVE